MGKFLQIMSQNDSKALVARASQINTQARIAQEEIVHKLKNEKAQIEINIQNLTDFAPDTTQSLRPGTKNWNPSQWAKDLQAQKVAYYTVNLNLKIAEDTLKEFFGDGDEDADDATIIPTED